MQNLSQTSTPIMRVLPAAKPKINLYEYRFLDDATRDTLEEHFDAAVEAVRIYAKLHLNMCLADEATALRRRRATQPARILQLA